MTALHLRHGGAEKMIAALANLFCEQGHRVVLLCTYDLGEPAYRLDERVEIRYLTRRHPNPGEFRAALAARRPLAVLREGFYAVGTLIAKKVTMIRAIRQVREGTILSSRTEHAVWLSRYGRPGVRKIAQLHHDHEFDPKLLADFKKRYGHIDVCVLLVPSICREVAGFMAPGNTHTRCVAIPNFYTDEVFGEGDKTHTVVAVGRLHPEKGFDRLLAAWAKADRGDWTLTLVGGGDEEAALRSQAEALGIADAVHFTGMLSYKETVDTVRRAGVLAMTSRTECFGLVLLEAMCNETPPVAFDVRVGPEAIIRDGEDGFLVPDGDTDAFARRLEQLMQDEALRTAMGRRAAENVTRFSKEAVARQWADILNT